MAMTTYCYVAGPLTAGDPALNIRETCRIADILQNNGIVPFVPHLYFLWHLTAPADYEKWMRLCLAWVERCDALLRLPGESPGADREVAHAEKHGIKVYGDAYTKAHFPIRQLLKDRPKR
jgi:hypothetical protein